MKTSLELSNCKLQLIWLSKFKTAMNFLQIDPLLVQSILPGQTPALNDSITIGPFSLHRPLLSFYLLIAASCKKGAAKHSAPFPLQPPPPSIHLPNHIFQIGSPTLKKTDNTSSQALTRDLFLRICLSHPLSASARVHTLLWKSAVKLSIILETKMLLRWKFVLGLKWLLHLF